MAAVAAGCWALLLRVTGSFIAGTALLLLLGSLGAGCVLGLRSMGVNADHPWVRQLAARPWRDGQDVLQLGLRHLADVFVVTPAGSLLAPNSVQLRLSPRDFGALSELMDIGLVNSSAAEVYEDQVAARGARFAGPGLAEVSVISDPAVPAGRYVVRQGRPPEPAYRPGPMAGFRHAHDGHTSAGAVSAGTVITGLPTVAEPVSPPVPLLTLVTGDCLAQTRMSGACAGRGAVDLVLPGVPTVSREHARFTFADGQWRIANLGRNGLTLNGVPVQAGHVVRDGDVIRWGRAPDALVSRVEIG